MNRDCSSPESQQALLPAPGCIIPKYGINNGDSVSVYANNKAQSNSTVAAIIPFSSSRRQRVWAEAACSLIACIASLMIGMIVGFSSPTLTQLDRPKHLNQRIEAETIYASVFGVSKYVDVFMMQSLLNQILFTLMSIMHVHTYVIIIMHSSTEY